MSGTEKGCGNPATIGIVVRSTLFNVIVTLVSVAYLVCLPAALAPRRVGQKIMASYVRLNGWLLKIICGVSHEVRGRENMPDGAVLIAAKHQSAWDSVMFPFVLGNPAMTTRLSNLRLPVMSLIVVKLGHIVIGEPANLASINRFLRQAHDRIAEGRSVAIFPEGTRSAIGQRLPYQPGVIALYRTLDVPCVPIALNSGCFWPRRRLVYFPGKIIVEILPPIAPGLDRERFVAILTERIETATARLVEGVDARPVIEPQRAPAADAAVSEGPLDREKAANR